MVPIYTKPNMPKRRKKPGAKNGNPGARPTPIDRRLKRCPHRGGRVQRCHHVRARTVEDLPEDTRTEVAEHTIHRDYCPNCKKDVEPVVAEARPGATLGHRLLALPRPNSGTQRRRSSGGCSVSMGTPVPQVAGSAELNAYLLACCLKERDRIAVFTCLGLTWGWREQCRV